MRFTKTFSELTKHDAEIAGGKGASLGEMTQVGISVPGGFVVLSTTFNHFLEVTDLTQEIQSILGTVDHKVIHTVDSASEKIRGLIESREIPQDIAIEIQNEFKKLGSDFVAVRSSATAEDGSEHAWAGQLESFLNTDETTLLDNIKKCWGSLFTPRATFYRFEKKLHGTDISVAVVVQKMVQSEISGIAFSVHPVTEDRNQLIIEAGYGLGEAIVSGSITPDSYVVEKEPRQIIDINVSNQKRGLYRKQNGGNEWRDIPEQQGASQVLHTQQILELSEIILNIENHYGFPCDIEWAYEDGKFYIVQSRPITTLSNKSEDVSTIVLSKVFSREKTLFYFSMWNDSDRMGWKDFLNYDVKNNLFIVPPPGRKGSVWYSQNELNEIDTLLKKKMKSDKNLITKFRETLDTNWEIIFPYLSDKKRVSSVEEFEIYYRHLVRWWSAMNTAFGIPDMEEVPEEIRTTFLSYRTESEKYTEKMNKVLVAFWNEHFPDLLDLTFYITPTEVTHIIANRKSVIAQIQDRKNGCFMLNGKIYPLKELDQILNEQYISLEKVAVEDEQDIRGSTAYKGKVIGKVRKIMSFKDMGDFQGGEVLVTEMTNPDYLPIMKIAVAVVTDEGGATCHAAIASRELKIPCVVGTKIATQILNDGDMVEVDADNGVIKIINKHA